MASYWAEVLWYFSYLISNFINNLFYMDKICCPKFEYRTYTQLGQSFSVLVLSNCVTMHPKQSAFELKS